MKEHGRGDIVEALTRLERAGKTGVLELRAETVLTRVLVEKGVPVAAEAGVVGETLGHVLVREQVITSDQFAATVRRMTDVLVDEENENVRFGDVVVELGILTREALDVALASQVEKKLMGCVARGAGEWTFESKDAIEGAKHPTPIRVVLVDAAKLLSEERLEDILRLPTDTFPCAVESLAKIADAYGLEAAELEAVRRIDGKQTAKSLIDAAFPDVEWHALLAALVMGGSVELLAEHAAKSPPPTVAVTAPGRRRAARVRAPVVELPADSLRPRPISLRPARNDREATLFAEDEFQAGKRLFAQGKLAEAHAQLVLARDRSPDITLYELYVSFVASRMNQGFADRAGTKSIAVKMVKKDPDCAFAHYVLGHVALDEGSPDAALRFFKQAFRLDPEMLDAGRQARMLEKRSSTKVPAPAAYRNVAPVVRSAKTPKVASPNARLYRLLILFAIVTAGTIGYMTYVTYWGGDYTEVR